MSKKCLLTSSPRIGRTFPRGVIQIASYLEANACPTEVLPLAYYLESAGTLSPDLTPEDEGQIEDIPAAAIRRTNPLVVGISNPYTLGFPDCLKVLAICRRINEGF